MTSPQCLSKARDRRLDFSNHWWNERRLIVRRRQHDHFGTKYSGFETLLNITITRLVLSDTETGPLFWINPSYQSHNALDKYPTMHRVRTFLSRNNAVYARYGTCALWDLCNRSVAAMHCLEMDILTHSLICAIKITWCNNGIVGYHYPINTATGLLPRHVRRLIPWGV